MLPLQWTARAPSAVSAMVKNRLNPGRKEEMYIYTRSIARPRSKVKWMTHSPIHLYVWCITTKHFAAYHTSLHLHIPDINYLFVVPLTLYLVVYTCINTSQALYIQKLSSIYRRMFSEGLDPSGKKRSRCSKPASVNLRASYIRLLSRTTVVTLWALQPQELID